MDIIDAWPVIVPWYDCWPEPSSAKVFNKIENLTTCSLQFLQTDYDNF